MNKGIAESIRLIAKGLADLADALLLEETAEPVEPSEPQPVETTQPEQPVEVKKPKKAQKKKSEDEVVTHEALRELLGNLAAAGHSDEVAALLKEYGEGKLSTVPESNYKELYSAAKELETEKAGDEDA